MISPNRSVGVMEYWSIGALRFSETPLHYSNAPTPQSSSFALPGHFHHELSGEKFFSAADFFCLSFDAGGADERFYIFLRDGDRVKSGKLINHHAYRRRIAELIFSDDGSGDLLLIVSEKFQSPVDGAQDRNDAFGIRFDLLFAGNDHHEGKPSNDAADVEQSG